MPPFFWGLMKINNVKKNFKDAIVIDGITISFDQGIAHGLLGANGVGKSTLIKMLMGLVRADQGEIENSESISLLPENPYLPDNLSAFQIVSHACRMQKQNDEVTRALLSEVLLKEESWFKPVRTYSKGMKQRTAIAYALAGSPKWLILDEPMSGLDAMGRKQMLDVFEKRKASKMSLLMCSHSVTDLVRLCQKVHVMAEGKICETVEITDHSMAEAESLEACLENWTADYALD